VLRKVGFSAVRSKYPPNLACDGTTGVTLRFVRQRDRQAAGRRFLHIWAEDIHQANVMLVLNIDNLIPTMIWSERAVLPTWRSEM